MTANSQRRLVAAASHAWATSRSKRSERWCLDAGSPRRLSSPQAGKLAHSNVVNQAGEVGGEQSYKAKSYSQQSIVNSQWCELSCQESHHFCRRPIQRQKTRMSPLNLTPSGGPRTARRGSGNRQALPLLRKIVPYTFNSPAMASSARIGVKP